MGTSARLTPRAIAAMAWLAAVGLSIAATALGAANGRPPEVFLPLTVSGLAYGTAAAVICLRRPNNPTGIALAVAAALPAALVIFRYLLPQWGILFTISFATQAYLVPLAYVVLTFPTGSFARSRDRAVLLALTAVGLVAGVIEMITVEPPLELPPASCAPCTTNPIRIGDGSLYPTISSVDNVVLLVAGIVITALLVQRWRDSIGLMRAALTPVVAGAGVLAVGYGVTTILIPILGISPSLTAPLLLALRLLIPVGLAVVFVRFYGARTTVIRELVRLGPRMRLVTLETTLREAVGDPSLAVLRPSGAGGYVDTQARPVDFGAASERRLALPVEQDGALVAQVVVDPALQNDPELVEVIKDTVRYATESSEIQDELIARGGDVNRLPRGEVTFLFGDVERSTELLSRLGEAYAGTIERLREIVRQNADEHAGQVVDMRADECFVAFARPDEALAAATGIAAALAAERWPGGEHVQLRIGLHTGRPALTTSGYVGLDVHHAARVMAAAIGGQVMTSTAFVDALGANSAARSKLSALGAFALRGIPGEETLYEVTPA